LLAARRYWDVSDILALAEEGEGAVTARDLFGVIVRTIGLGFLLIGFLRMFGDGVELLITQAKFGFSIPLTLAQVAMLFSQGPASIVFGLIWLFAAGGIVRLIYGPERSNSSS
jgi:hypothetical protein